MMSEGNNTAVLAVAKGNRNFSINLYEILKKKEGNVFFSPISADVVLALLYTGARGKTAQQIVTALSLPQDQECILPGYSLLLQTLKSTDGMTLVLATRVFTQTGCVIKSNFQSVAETTFQSGAQELNFQNDLQKSLQVINTWVNDKTKGKIKEIVSKGLLCETTRLVLVNAVYFKGKWKLPFAARSTGDDFFMVSASEKRPVRMMHLKESFRYANLPKLEASALEMPYKDGNLSFLIILPDQVDGISKLESHLVDLDIAGILNSLDHEEVILALPKFRLDQLADLGDCLKELGMKDMFDSKCADLTGLSETKPPLVVGSVLQKAFIEVDELGSEAGAATAISCMLGSAPGAPPKRFRADHPFIFAVVETTTATPLFMGRFSCP